MISEELVASGGTHTREADMPEGSHKATATQQPRVSGAPRLPGPALALPASRGIREAGDLEICPGDGLLCLSGFSLTLVPLASHTPGG